MSISIELILVFILTLVALVGAISLKALMTSKEPSVTPDYMDHIDVGGRSNWLINLAGELIVGGVIVLTLGYKWFLDFYKKGKVVK